MPKSEQMQNRRPTLPEELLWRIAYFITSPYSSSTLGLEDSADLNDIDTTFFKPAWTDVQGFAMGSKALRYMILRNWFRVFHIRSDDDWKVYEERYPFVFRYTTAIIWHGVIGIDPGLNAARNFFTRFAGRSLRSVRLILPVPGDQLLNLEYTPEYPDYLKVIGSCCTSGSSTTDTSIPNDNPAPTTITKMNTITKLEIYNDLYPVPDSVRLIAEAVPQLEELRWKQPSIWCNLCFTCSLPRFSNPLPVDKVLKYPDGRGLPAHWASRLSVLPNLHTVLVTVGVKYGPRPFMFPSSFPSSLPATASNTFRSFPWTGECEMCLSLMDRDPTLLDTCFERKMNNKKIPPNLKRVEWRFVSVDEFENGSDWNRISRYLYE
ncbi:hypothetical protein ACEPAG_9068 [Sanghuangporus baumii]